MWLLVAATLAIGIAWGVVVPPFEGPDESAFYQGIVSYARGQGRYGLPMYSVMLGPAVKLAGGPDTPFRSTYNPSFRFVSNEYGRVNMFMHGRAEGAQRADIRRMDLLRLLTLMMWLAALVLVFETARHFFGRGDLALLIAILCLTLPQFSFFASKIHPEATATLLASVAYFAFTARLYGRIGRVSTWALAMIVLALAPLSDRQAYFLLALVPFGLITTETSKRNAAVAAAALVTSGLLLLFLPQFGELQRDLQTSFAPFLPGYPAGWWSHDTPQFLIFEMAPKLFFGFCGWLGQPSILLPAPIYAAMAVPMMLGIVGLFMSNQRERLTSEQRKVAGIFAVGVILTFVPIVYYNILVARTSYGRWLFPSIGPIMIGLVFGFRSFALEVRHRPHAVAMTMLGVAAVLWGIWVTPFGDAIRAGIDGNHYGDRAHLSQTVAETIAALAIAALVLEAIVLLSKQLGAPLRRRAPLTIAALCGGANLLILFGFVAPLYRPPDVDAFVDTVRGELIEGETRRAGALYRIGVSAFPTSTHLRRLAAEAPILLLGDSDDQMVAELQSRIGRGERLSTRAELMALARVVRAKGWLEPEALRQVLEQSKAVPELAEASALIRAQLEGRTGDKATAADVIRAGGGALVPTDMHGDATLEGLTVHTVPAGYNQVTVYFRPLRPWAGRRLWIHAYPVSSQAYIPLDAEAPFDGWRVGELSWEVFHVPAHGRYNAYLGVAIGDELGPGYPLGWIGR